MNRKTLSALKQSIKKWDQWAVVDITYVDLGVWSCPLCDLFHPINVADGPRGSVNYTDNPCAGCPVKEAGHPLCNDTPYEKAEEVFDAAFEDDDGDDHHFRIHAKAEADFLRSLLPEEEK